MGKPTGYEESYLRNRSCLDSAGNWVMPTVFRPWGRDFQGMGVFQSDEGFWEMRVEEGCLAGGFMAELTVPPSPASPVFGSPSANVVAAALSRSASCVISRPRKNFPPL